MIWQTIRQTVRQVPHKQRALVSRCSPIMSPQDQVFIWYFSRFRSRGCLGRSTTPFQPPRGGHQGVRLAPLANAGRVHLRRGTRRKDHVHLRDGLRALRTLPGCHYFFSMLQLGGKQRLHMQTLMTRKVCLIRNSLISAVAFIWLLRLKAIYQQFPFVITSSICWIICVKLPIKTFNRVWSRVRRLHLLSDPVWALRTTEFDGFIYLFIFWLLTKLTVSYRHIKKQTS